MEDIVTHFFIRRKGKDGSTHRCGCVAIKKPASDSLPFKVAYSVVSPSDNFRADKARIMALGRLESKRAKEFHELPRDFNELVIDLGITQLVDRFRIDDNRSDDAYMGAQKNLTPKEEDKSIQVGDG